MTACKINKRAGTSCWFFLVNAGGNWPSSAASNKPLIGEIIQFTIPPMLPNTIINVTTGKIAPQ